MLDDSMIDLSAGAVSPRLALANLMLRYVDLLTPGVALHDDDQQRERHLDVLVGLVAGAEAFHAAERGDVDEGEEYLNLALRRLTG